VNVAALNSHLISDSQGRSGDDPIFALNAEATRRAKAGESIVNATLGALMEDDGRLATMPVVFETLAAVPPDKAAAYAPIAGEPRFLAAVIKDLYGESQLAQDSVAAATPGGTGALHHAVVNFLAPGEALLTPSYYWGPYRTIAQHTGRRVETFLMFDGHGAFNVSAFAQALESQIQRQSRALILLNTPCNNPTGYSLDDRDWTGLVTALRAAASQAPVALCLDLAYARFGAAAPNHWVRHVQPLVGRSCSSPRGPRARPSRSTAARVGALVASHSSADERTRIKSALSFSCRGTWSNCNHLGMLAMTELLENPQLRARADAERERLRALLGERVAAFNRAAAQAGLIYPRYEGGFFVTVFTPDPAATAERMKALGVYVVPIDGAVRVALCSTPLRDVPRVIEALTAGLAAVVG
jgi:aromatic-amino-acid transaminase